MSFYQLFYHLVWSTKNRQPALTSEVRPIIHGYLRAKASGLGAIVFALDGTDDHVHLVASIPPTIAVARFVGQVKAVASTRFNKSHPDVEHFFWQDEYGAFSFDGKRLPNLIAYVNQQTQHHSAGTVLPVLERTSGGVPTILREDEVAYGCVDEAWRREMQAFE